MCGLISLSSSLPVERARLKRAADALAHRGPDGEGFWISPDGHTGLGHRRLGIIGLDDGAQPIANEDETLHIIVNSEFYGFEEIREELRGQGHRFRTASDSEIALHLYEQYGLAFTSRLRGEFALVLHDAKNNRLVAARDRFGIKPLCYAQDAAGTLYVASEAKAIFAAGFAAAWDADALFHACSVQYTPPDRTLFEGVRQLQPGHLLVFENGHLTLQKYWDIDYPQEPLEDTRSDADWISLFRGEFETAVRLRLRSDVPVCFHLSGGIDSSAIAATAAKLSAAPVTCFTVRFAQEGYDEFPVAREMAARMGAELHAVEVSAQDMVDYIPDAVYYSEGMAVNGHLAGKFLLNRAIHAAGFKVSLSGEGADELLAGYPHFREDMIALDAAQEPRRAALYQSNSKLAGLFLAHGETLPTQAVEEALGYLPSFLKAKASLGRRMTALLADDYAEAMRHRDVYAEVVAAFDVGGQLAARHVVNQSSYLWTKMVLAGYILKTLGDGCEMAHAVEGRVPFLDHRLFELARQMPMHLKIRDMVEKYVLREAARPLLTEAVYKRQKHPFIAPPVSRAPALDARLQDTLRSAAFARMGFFDAKRVRDWLDALAAAPEAERIAAEPPLMMMLTAFFIGQKFGLQGG
ncbi:MAG: asparagine synthase (glutamine-hydrolyzing) [Alphaproteobacteria bacterium]|nr:asparagine synthase (glutamine-hydrolyzing) [Alphaproteobacteria bacterium]